MNKYWFRKRRGLFSWDLGWGWVPISYEGWLVTAILLIAILLPPGTIVLGTYRWFFFLIAMLFFFSIIADAKSKEKVLWK